MKFSFIFSCSIIDQKEIIIFDLNKYIFFFLGEVLLLSRLIDNKKNEHSCLHALNLNFTSSDSQRTKSNHENAYFLFCFREKGSIEYFQISVKQNKKKISEIIEIAANKVYWGKEIY